MLEREVGRQLRATNGFAGTVPSFSAVRITGAALRNVTINRPNADSSLNLAITGPQIFANAGKGHVSMDWPLWVETSGSPVAGDEVGTENGAFTMKKGNTGFLVLVMSGTLALIAPKGGTATWEANT